MARMRQFINDLGFIAEGDGDPNSAMPPSADGMVGVDEGSGIPDGEIHRQVQPGEMDGLPNPKPAQSSEGPRQRAQLRQAQAGKGVKATPTRPRTPTPAAGTQSGPDGVVPFNPLPSGGPGETMAGPMIEDPAPGGFGGGDMGGPMAPSPISGGGGASLRGLLGSAGGLQGGGLGLPFDPVANETSDPIALLMKQLLGQ